MHGLLLIGCGNMANVHCRQLMELDNLKLVCAADTQVARTLDFKEKYGFERTSGNYKEELVSEDIDVVLTATTWQPRFQIIKDCLEAGKHVLAEKPLSLYIDEIDELMEISARNKAKLRVGYILRASAMMQKAGELIKSGAIGKPLAFSVTHHQRGFDRDWVILKNLLRGGVTSGIDCGIHICDILRHWFETEPDSVYCLEQKLNQDCEGDNFSHAAFKMKNGISATIEECFSKNSISYSHMAINGDNGSIFPKFGKNGGKDTITLQKPEDKESVLIELDAKGKATGKQMERFLKDIETDADLTDHLADVRKSTEMALGAMLSAKKGQLMKFPLGIEDIKEIYKYIRR